MVIEIPDSELENAEAVEVVSTKTTDKHTPSKVQVEVHHKAYLTLAEASAYFNIGTTNLREITNPLNSPYVMYIGSKRLLNRVKMEEYFLRCNSI